MELKFYKKILKNGMTIILEKRDMPVVSVAFAVKNGGVNEDVHEKGISHFIEHLLYKGTPKRNAQKIAEEIEKNGGILNGFTSEEITAFWCKMPSKHLDVALDVLGDMIKNPLFDEKEIDKEREVIFEEIKMYQDNPRMHIFDEIQRLLFKDSLGMPLIGTTETLSKISRKKIIDKFKKVYHPNNMILCVVGEADFDALVDFAEKNFKKTKGKVPKNKISKKIESKIERRKGIDQANVVLAHHIPTAKDKKSYAAFVLNVLMAGGMSSRLFSEIREKRNLAYSVKGQSEINKDFAYSLIQVGTKKENIKQVEHIILEEFKKVSKELKEKELNSVKNQIIGNHQISIEESVSQMTNLLHYEINGDAKKLYEFEKNIRAVNLKDVKSLAKNIKKGKYSFFVLLPED